MKYKLGVRAALKTVDLILATCSVRTYGLDAFLRTIGSTSALLAIWHNRIALAPYVLSPYLDHAEKIFALISKNRDGNWIQALVDIFPNADTIRKKIHALQDVKASLQGGKNLVIITPDGSRGPPCCTKPGIISIAKETGFPIIPLTWEGPSWQLNSWDQFRIPKPFSEINIHYQSPLYLSRSTSTEEDKKKLDDLLNFR